MNDTSVSDGNTNDNKKSLTMGYPPSETKTDVQTRWYLLGLLTLWIIEAIVVPLLAFCLTGNLYCLSGFSALAPPVYVSYRIVGYLFPKYDEWDYKIKLEEIRAGHSKWNQHKKEEVS